MRGMSTWHSGSPKRTLYSISFGPSAVIAACDGVLKTFDVRWWDDAALTVVMAAQGYPGAFERGSEIRGLAEAEALDDVLVFHAGTRADGGRLLANGGRVLNVTAIGRTVAEAQKRAYAAVAKIEWPQGFCRRDIGWRALKKENEAKAMEP